MDSYFLDGARMSRSKKEREEYERWLAQQMRIWEAEDYRDFLVEVENSDQGGCEEGSDKS